MCNAINKRTMHKCGIGFDQRVPYVFSYVKARECYWDHISPILDGT